MAAAKKKEVRAVRPGFYDGERKRPGDVFEVDAKDNAKWFVDAKEPASKKAKKPAKPEYRKAQEKKAAETAKVAATRDPDSVADLV